MYAPKPPMPSLEIASDAELVAASLAGERTAFARIVERYQRLLCSLAYSATGSLSESEDVAQETFLAAWRQLGQLREPDKLRPWLCGILRHQLSRFRRRDGREPVRQAEQLEATAELDSAELAAADQAMHAEERAMLWRTLEKLPEVYREPLILYYREHQSVEHVAAALDLTEDAVKQRLARGRRMLQEQVLAFVAGALSRTTPAKAFTAAVLAALPAALPTPAKAIGLGAATAQGGVLAKWTGLAAFVASVSGIVNLILSLRAALDQTRTPRERRMVVRTVLVSFGGFFAFLGLLYGLRVSAFQWWEHRLWFLGAAQAAVVVATLTFPFYVLHLLRRIRALRTAERARHPECFRDPVDQVNSAAGEYRSRLHLFGVPLVHLRFAIPEADAPPVFGWFAGGDRAYGLIFAWGTWAIAPISVGAFAIGLFSVGAVGVGLISLGTIATGLLAVGCFSIGIKAYAWLSALGWEAAQSGGFALARDAAHAPVAWAEHANTPLAIQMLTDPHAERNQMIFLILIALFSIVPVAAYAQAIRHRLGRRPPDLGSPPVPGQD